MDVITRLSVESVRKWNLRQQFIMNYDHDAIMRCLLQSEAERTDLDESANGEFLRVLKEMKSSTAEQELYPLGRVLWFVPNIVMNDDIDFRKRSLMNLTADDVIDNDYKIELEKEKTKDENAMDVDDGNNKIKEKSKVSLSFVKDLINSTWNKVGVGIKQFKESVIDPESMNARIESDVSMSDLFREFRHDLCHGLNDVKTEIRCQLDRVKEE